MGILSFFSFSSVIMMITRIIIVFMMLLGMIIVWLLGLNNPSLLRARVHGNYRNLVLQKEDFLWISLSKKPIFLSFEAIKTWKGQKIREFTLGIVSGHQVEDMQAFWPPGMQSFACSRGLKSNFCLYKSRFFSFLT